MQERDDDDEIRIHDPRPRMAPPRAAHPPAVPVGPQTMEMIRANLNNLQLVADHVNQPPARRERPEAEHLDVNDLLALVRRAVVAHHLDLLPGMIRQAAARPVTWNIVSDDDEEEEDSK